MASVPVRNSGLASAINNAVSRVGQPLLSAAIFIVITATVERTLGIGRRELPLVAFGIVALFVNQLSFVYALDFTNATTTALLFGTLPILTALISRVVGIDRLGRRFWIAGVFSFAGVALVTVGSGHGLSGDVGGDLLAILTAATWAAYSVAVAPLMRGYSPYQISAVVLFVGWVPLAATGAGQLASQDWGGVGWLDWVCLVYALLGPLVLTNVLWFKAIDRVGPSRATLFANLQPFVAAIFALAILSEKITLLQVLGGVAIGVGILLSRGRGRRARPAAPEVEEERVPATKAAAR
jgi:drug/metabolite transporter (DMT)-like permease